MRIIQTYPGNEEVVFYPIPIPGQVTPPPIVHDVYTPGFISLQGDFTRNSSGSRHDWKSFQHYKSVRLASKTNAPVTCYWDDYGVYPIGHSVGAIKDTSAGYLEWHPSGTLEPYGQDGTLDGSLEPLYIATPSGFVPPPSNLEQLTKSALASMLPIIKAEVSLPNFIYELKDFKRPIAKVASVFKSSSFKAALKKLGLTSNGLTFKKLLQGAAGSYLNYSFNLRPLVTDSVKIYNALSRTERRINDFITRAGKPQNKHYVYKWPEMHDSYEERTNSGAQSWENSAYRTVTHNVSRRVTYDPAEFHAQIQYNYNYTGYQTEHAQLLGHLDALGVNLNPAIIWNALPWTFVIDWVLGVSPYLDSMKSENMRPVINIRRYLWSIRRSRLIQVSKGTRCVGGTVLSLGYMPGVRQTAYRRDVGLPSMSSIQSSGLTSSEVSLGAALVISRRRRPKRS